MIGGKKVLGSFMAFALVAACGGSEEPGSSRRPVDNNGGTGGIDGDGGKGGHGGIDGNGGIDGKGGHGGKGGAGGVDGNGGNGGKDGKGGHGGEDGNGGTGGEKNKPEECPPGLGVLILEKDYCVEPIEKRRRHDRHGDASEGVASERERRGGEREYEHDYGDTELDCTVDVEEIYATFELKRVGDKKKGEAEEVVIWGDDKEVLFLEPGTYKVRELCDAHPYPAEAAFTCENDEWVEFEIAEGEISEVEFRNLLNLGRVEFEKKVKGCYPSFPTDMAGAQVVDGGYDTLCDDVVFEIEIERKRGTPLVCWDGKDGFRVCNEGVAYVTVDNPAKLLLPFGEYEAKERRIEGFDPKDFGYYATEMKEQPEWHANFADKGRIDRLVVSKEEAEWLFVNLFDYEECHDYKDNDWDGEEDCEELICQLLVPQCSRIPDPL